MAPNQSTDFKDFCPQPGFPIDGPNVVHQTLIRFGMGVKITPLGCLHAPVRFTRVAISMPSLSIFFAIS
jgi:hypothetical protein